MKRPKVIAILLGLTCSIFLSDYSSSVIITHLNIEEMTDTAQYIFSGFCTGIESRHDEETGREAIFLDFKISQMIKGKSTDDFTFKMSKVAVDIGEIPLFKIGDEVVLFLYGRSSSGFTSPVGLGQGKFSVKYSTTGERVVVNEHNNLNIFKGLDRTKYLSRFAPSKYATDIERVMTQQSGPIDYQTFITLIENILQ